MLADQHLIAFVSVPDLARSKHFYQDTLGLTLVTEDPYVLFFEVNGTQLCVHGAGSKFTPAPYTVLGWIVDDIAAEIASLNGKGITMQRFPGMEQDPNGVWTPLGGGPKVAWFKDPDGNVLSLTQMSSR